MDRISVWTFIVSGEIPSAIEINDGGNGNVTTEFRNSNVE